MLLTMLAAAAFAGDTSIQYLGTIPLGHGMDITGTSLNTTCFIAATPASPAGGNGSRWFSLQVGPGGAEVGSTAVSAGQTQLPALGMQALAVDGPLVYSTDGSSHSLAVFDTATSSDTELGNPGSAAEQPCAIDTTEGIAYCSPTAIDLHSGVELSRRPTDNGTVASAVDSPLRLLLTAGPASVAAYAMRGGGKLSLQSTLPVAGGISDMAVDASRGLLFVSGGGGVTVVRYAGEGTAVPLARVAVAEVPGGVAAVAADADQRRVYAASPEGVLSVWGVSNPAKPIRLDAAGSATRPAGQPLASPAVFSNSTVVLLGYDSASGIASLSSYAVGSDPGGETPSPGTDDDGCELSAGEIALIALGSAMVGAAIGGVVGFRVRGSGSADGDGASAGLVQ